MDLDLSAEQHAIRDELRAFLAEEPGVADGVRRFAERGWLALAAGVDSPRGIFALALLFEEIGRAAWPGPLINGVVESGRVVAGLDREKCHADALLGITSGQRNFAFCFRDPSGSTELESLALRAEDVKDGFVVHGKAGFVPHAQDADELMVVARSESRNDGVSVFRIHARSPGIAFESLETIFDDESCDVVFDDVRVPGSGLIGPRGGAWPAIEDVLGIATLARCAETLGDAEAALTIAVDYAARREQFGQPIGAFQALQHQAADRKVDVDACRLAVYEAASRIDAGLPAEEAVASAALICGEAAPRVAATAHQIHGAIGYYADSPLEQHTRRIQHAVLRLGSAASRLDRIAGLAGL
ncbi:MAG: acyl-CoA dehydrogenase [Myxococcales bacterium]|nr:acyl-CoA dehydrogenase [Myxococcales bacterium]